MKLWDVDTGQEKPSLTGHTSWVRSVAFSPDGQTLASGSRDDTVKLWDVDTGQEKASLTGHTSSVYSVAFSPDGQTLASGSCGRYGEVVGRGHRAGKGLPHRTYGLRSFGGVFAGWTDPGKWQWDEHDEDCGTWTQGRKRPPSQDIRLRSFGGVFA